MSSDANSRRPSTKQKKTYGKGVKSHLSGWFGRDLWSAVEPAVAPRKKGADKGVVVIDDDDDALAEKQLVKEEEQRLTSDTDKSMDGGVKLKTPAAVMQEVLSTEVAVIEEVRVEEMVSGKESNFTDLEAEIDGILESMGKLDVQTSNGQAATTTIDLTTETEQLDPETRSTHSLSSAQFKENSDKENEEPQSTPPLSPIHHSQRNSRRKPPASPENTPREALRERSISPDRSAVLESPVRKNGVRKRGASRSAIYMQSPASSPLRKEGKKVPQGSEIEGEMENPITVWEDEDMGAIQAGPLVNLLGRNASRVELLEIPDSEDGGEEEENASTIMTERVKSQPNGRSPSVGLDKGDQGYPIVDLEEVCLEKFSEESHEERPVSSVGSFSVERLLRLCTNPSILDFEEHIDSLLENSSIRKLGEASYSEVFLQSTPGSSSTVLKIIPFGGLDQCQLESIVQEVRITKAMGEIEGFIGFRGAYVVQGYFPQLLMDEWDIYDEEHGSENERPHFYADDQQFAVICLENGGVDLEHFDLHGWEEAWEVFWQVTLALARGEKERDFEHRDLHYGNIVIQRESSGEDFGEELLGKLSLQDSDTDQSEPESKPKQNKTRNKLKVALIDYTLSRAVCGTDEDKDAGVEFAPLDDDALFTGKGDYQFDIYRFMRNHLSSGLVDPSEEWIDWNVYAPKTNIYWLHYLTNILLNRKQIPRPAARGRNAATEEQKKCYKNLEAAAKVLDTRKRKFGKDQVDCCSALELVDWAVAEGICGQGI